MYRPGDRAPEAVGARVTAKYLRAGGQALWAALNDRTSLDAATKALVLQACREVDILDRLSTILGQRETWLSLADEVETTRTTVTVKVVVDNALGEFRQHATTLSNLLSKLGLGKVDFDALKSASSGGYADELAAKRAALFAQLDSAQDPEQSG